MERQAGRTVVTIETDPGDDIAAILWDQYYEAFEPLQDLALLNHLYTRRDFDALMMDRRVVKLIGWKRGEPVGLAMMTNALDVVPQISPPFLRRRYPGHAERDAIFFAIFIYVAAGARSPVLFARLTAGMAQLAAACDGVLVFDICRHNLDSMNLDKQLAGVCSWFPHSSFEEIDSQTYFAAKFPEPLRSHRRVPTLPAAFAGEPRSPSVSRLASPAAMAPAAMAGRERPMEVLVQVTNQA